jgi:glutamate/tyrosine decarboxylase-like PLP-dependent enzyme
MNLQHWLSQAAESVRDWQSGYPAFETHPSLQISDERFTAAFAEFADRMRDNYPYFHPSYAGQMLKPPHPAAVAGYLAAMLVNPNNHALDGVKVTSEMEKEVVADLAAMFGLTTDHGGTNHGGTNHGGTYLGHLTSSGTIANLEALYVARELHPGRGVAYSADAHYTHGRMCGVLGINGTAVGTDAAGRIDLDALHDLLSGGTIGTVVATAGTTGLGAIDPVHDVLSVARRHGVRVHVDAAYGGFFTLLAGAGGRTGLDPRPWRAIAECDSVVVDPHKHGLQPYGCGAVVHLTRRCGWFHAHDWFAALHVRRAAPPSQPEGSRAAPAAAAPWPTFRLLPPAGDGSAVPRLSGAALTGPTWRMALTGCSCFSARTRHRRLFPLSNSAGRLDVAA